MIKTMIAIALAAACATGGANAQGFPSRPITILVPLAPGGSTDTIARIMAEGMKTHLGQPVIVENSPGAGGSTGVIRGALDARRLHRADRAMGHQCRQRRGV
jgi:tripartite-type tricarboxylate transporter receptor subunit TctC